MVCKSVANVISIDGTNQGGFNGFIGCFAFSHILAPNIAPKPQVIPHAQPISDLSLGSFNSTRHHRPNIGSTDVSISHLSPWISMLIHTLA